MTASGGGDDLSFDAAEGRAFATRAYRAAGLAADDAAAVAAMTILSDLRGIDSHGITRLPIYINRLRSGATNPEAEFRIVAEAPATAVIDGDNGMGHLVMRHATELAIAKAKQCGIAWVGARMSNHAGAAAIYPMMALPHDMVGLYLAVANNNHVAPWGGLQPLLGTNPIAVAIPTMDEPPIVLDIATTTVSNGRISLAVEKGEALEPGWMMDREGNDLLDANRSGEGLLLPMAGYKGAGLSLVFALLGATLNGAPAGRALAKVDPKGASQTGQAIMIINPASFGPIEQFKRETDIFARDIRTSKPAPGVAEVRYPGLQGHRTMMERERAGIPMDGLLKQKLDKLAAELGIEALKTR